MFSFVVVGETFSRPRTKGEQKPGRFSLSFDQKSDLSNEIKDCHVKLERLSGDFVTSRGEQILTSLMLKKLPVPKTVPKRQEHMKTQLPINGSTKRTALKKVKLKEVQKSIRVLGKIRREKREKLKSEITEIKGNAGGKRRKPSDKEEDIASGQDDLLDNTEEADDIDEVEDVGDDSNEDDYEPPESEDDSEEEAQLDKLDEDYQPFAYKPKNKTEKQKQIDRKVKELKKNEMKEKIKTKRKKAEKGVFPCGTCKNVYTFKRSYLTHFKSGRCENQCKYCGKVGTRKTIKIHIFYKHEKNDVRFICDICGRRFFQEYMLQNHMKAHNGTDVRVCDLCGKSFTNHASFFVHKRKHEREAKNIKFQCPLCKKLYASKEYVQYHLQYTHADEKHFMCDICGSSFKTEPSLKTHKRATHQQLRCYKCDVCNKTYKYSHQVSTHKKMFHQKLTRFRCQICNKAFYFEGQFKDHMNIHEGLKPHSCFHCDYVSSTRVQMTQHRRKHRKKLPEKEVVENVEAEQETAINMIMIPETEILLD